MIARPSPATPGRTVRGISLALLAAVFLACLAAPAAALELVPLWTYETGIFDDNAAETVAYDETTGRLLSTNASEKTVDVLDLADGSLLARIELPTAPSCVAAHGGVVAVAAPAASTGEPGTVYFLDPPAGAILRSVTVGHHPDMLLFTPDGRHLLVANEGEPSDDYRRDPPGSVSILSDFTADEITIRHATFEAFDAQRESLLRRGVRIFGPGASVSQDLEPEYIAIAPDSKTAWVVLQENNAIAQLDIAAAEFTGIAPLGYKDHSAAGAGLDASDRDGDRPRIANLPVWGMYQPDSFSTYTVEGITYLVTANEGDARGYAGFDEETHGDDAIAANPRLASLEPFAGNEQLGRLEVTAAPPTPDRLYSFGTRSFSIWRVDGPSELVQVYDSGDDFEQLMAQRYPAHFNADSTTNDFDDRSRNKGPEPEALALGTVAGRQLVFVGLERFGGLFVYDVTDPEHPVQLGYFTTRDFTAEPASSTAGDLGPEKILFLAPTTTGQDDALLAVANEVSGTVTLMRVEP